MEHNVAQLQDLLETLTKALAANPEEVRIEAIPSEESLVRFEVYCNPADLGKIIGRGGKRATAIRTLMKAKATQLNTRVLVDIKG